MIGSVPMPPTWEMSKKKQEEFMELWEKGHIVLIPKIGPYEMRIEFWQSDSESASKMAAETSKS